MVARVCLPSSWALSQSRVNQSQFVAPVRVTSVDGTRTHVKTHSYKRSPHTLELRVLPTNTGKNSTGGERKERKQPPTARRNSVWRLKTADRADSVHSRKLCFHFLLLFQECPSGMVKEETFKMIYSQFFPRGADASQYAHFVFNTFDQDNTGAITFTVSDFHLFTFLFFLPSFLPLINSLFVFIVTVRHLTLCAQLYACACAFGLSVWRSAAKPFANTLFSQT